MKHYLTYRELAEDGNIGNKLRGHASPAVETIVLDCTGAESGTPTILLGVSNDRGDEFVGQFTHEQANRLGLNLIMAASPAGTAELLDAIANPEIDLREVRSS